MKNHHTRKGYEKLYCNLLRESGNFIPPLSLSLMSDYELLGQINIELAKHNCMTYSYEEIKYIQCKINFKPV